MDTPERDEITAAEAARILGGVARETVYRYRGRGWLAARAERRGLRTWYWFNRAEVVALAERLAQVETK